MSNLHVTSINITLKTANDPVYAQPTSPEPTADRLRCNCWITCENPRCFKHGCINALPKQAKEVRHV